MSVKELSPVEIEPIPKNLYYKPGCATCNRKDVPFEQRNWEMCLRCTLDIRKFHIEMYTKELKEGRQNNSTIKRLEKSINGYIEIAGILAFSDIWQQVQAMEHYGLVTVSYDGKPEMKNWAGITLTNKGKKAIGRTELTLKTKQQIAEEETE